MTADLSSRDRVLKLFRGDEIDRIPVFSGYGNITVHGLEKHGWNFAEIHTDAGKMASMAASTYELFGFECAVAPFDMGVEAEVLGSKVNYYTHHTNVVYPTIIEHPAEKVADLELEIPADIAGTARIPIVTEASSILKREIGDKVAIGSWVLGPYTLAGQLVDLSDLSKSVFKRREKVQSILNTLADVLIKIINIYKEAGADYITVREMGAGGDILSPIVFEEVILPHLKKVFAGIESPKVLHMCGDTNSIVDQMYSAGADALSVEKRNDVIETRRKLGHDALIFGDIDPYGVLVEGSPDDIDKAVKEAIDAGVNAVWPGCDIWPTVPKENMNALVEAVRIYGRLE